MKNRQRKKIRQYDTRITRRIYIWKKKHFINTLNWEIERKLHCFFFITDFLILRASIRAVFSAPLRSRSAQCYFRFLSYDFALLPVTYFMKSLNTHGVSKTSGRTRVPERWTVSDNPNMSGSKKTQHRQSTYNTCMWKTRKFRNNIGKWRFDRMEADVTVKGDVTRWTKREKKEIIGEEKGKSCYGNACAIIAKVLCNAALAGKYNSLEHHFSNGTWWILFVYRVKCCANLCSKSDSGSF